MAGERVHDIGPERHFPRCTADPFCNRVIKILRKRNIRWDREIDNRDTGILAQGHAKLFCFADIVQDIVKFTAGYRICLGSRSTRNDPLHVRGQPDCGFAIGTERCIRKR
jgi:hypothetical protein